MFKNNKYMHLEILLSVILLLLTGCSSISVSEPIIGSKKEVLELSYCVVSSVEVDTVKDSISDEENKKELDKSLKIAINNISNTLQTGIKHTPDFHITALPKCIDDAEVLNLPSDLYLKVELSGFGSLKREWKNVLIGTGIAEGIIQGVIVGAATSNPWLGIAVGAEEIGSEYLTWNGVDWILGEAYAPVTLEASLLYINKNEIIWQDSFFVTENEDELNDAEKKVKSMQLKASLHKAVELLSSLNTYLQDEILKQHIN